MIKDEFFIDYSRCIGCEACVQACGECDTHRGVSMIHLETIERRDSVQTALRYACTVRSRSAPRFAPRTRSRKHRTGWFRVHSSHAALVAQTALCPVPLVCRSIRSISIR